MPSVAERRAARLETERRAKELVAAKALDRGNGDVLEPYLGALLAEWRARLHACGGPCHHSGRPNRSGGLSLVAEPSERDGEVRADAPLASRSVGLKALLVAAFAGDIANFYIALSAVGNASPLATLFVVVALTAASLGLAHGAGRSLRVERSHATGGDHDRPGRPAIVAMTGLWLAIGLTAATVRLLSPTTSAPAAGSFGAGSFGTTPVADGPDLTNLALTGLFLALFLASGAMAAIVGLAAGPDVERQRRVHRAWRRERASRMREERMRAEHAATDERCTAIVDELRSRAMHIIQCGLGEPGVTSATTWWTRAAG